MNLNAIVVVTGEHLASDLGEEIIVLQSARGTYFGMRGVGREVWSMLASPTPVRALVDGIVASYVVDREQAERDVISFLDELVAHDLVVTIEHP